LTSRPSYAAATPALWRQQHPQQQQTTQLQTHHHRRRSLAVAAALPPTSQRPTPASAARAAGRGRSRRLAVRAERKEYYDFKDMPPLPLGVKRIYIPELDYTVVDKATEEQRLASLAIFHDIRADEQYGGRLTRKSAITALCMFDQDDVSAAARRPGDYPNIDLLQRVYAEGLELTIELEEFGAPGGGAQ